MALPGDSTSSPAEPFVQLGDSLPRLLRRATARVELSTGYRFRFRADAGILIQLADTVERERQCCRFLRFHITVDHDLGPLTLDVSGSGDAKAFLANLLADGPDADAGDATSAAVAPWRR